MWRLINIITFYSARQLEGCVLLILFIAVFSLTFSFIWIADIVKMLDSQPDLAPLIRRVRGGYLKIQGTWMPYEVSFILFNLFMEEKGTPTNISPHRSH